MVLSSEAFAGISAALDRGPNHVTDRSDTELASFCRCLMYAEGL